MARSIASLLLALAAGCTSSNPLAPSAAEGFHIDHQDLSTSRGTGELGPDVLRELARVRRATARFHDIDQAMAAGYTVWSPDPFAAGATCPSGPTGQMGYHLVKPALRGSPANPGAADADLTILEPEMLLYEKRPDGSLHLVGVEYLVFTAAWERVHGAGAAGPQLFGRPVPASSHSFPPITTDPVAHYELHVWLWTSNPLGMFDHFNPTVSC